MDLHSSSLAIEIAHERSFGSLAWISVTLGKLLPAIVS